MDEIYNGVLLAIGYIGLLSVLCSSFFVVRHAIIDDFSSICQLDFSLPELCCV
jgi:hypothetical protein